DCVNCYRCVQVCPTGIDIRRGTQLECIACTACIDACDDVMTKTKRPTGLIRYTSETELKGKPWRRIRPRSIASTLLFAISLTGLISFAVLHQPLGVAMLRAKGAPYDVIQSEGHEDVIVNRFQIELSNQEERIREIEVSAVTDPANLPTPVKGATDPAPSGVTFVIAINPLQLQPGELRRVDMFVRAPRSVFHQGTSRYTVEIHDRSSGRRIQKEMTLVGPIF
ncbi:MAG: cytochrome c oxidase accessory protein CcoG, partial [Bdellovibrionaceae bacterium]|nr:cytochrome c oxidase accessory protein CcoG [Pseudobdellovibrionaceae bacterium]